MSASSKSDRGGDEDRTDEDTIRLLYHNKSSKEYVHHSTRKKSDEVDGNSSREDVVDISKPDHRGDEGSTDEYFQTLYHDDDNSSNEDVGYSTQHKHSKFYHY